MGVSGKWFITPHAVRRYRERCRIWLSYEDARDILIGLSMRARRIKERGPGVELWRGPKPERLRFIVTTR